MLGYEFVKAEVPTGRPEMGDRVLSSVSSSKGHSNLSYIQFSVLELGLF